jgi:hypothetical protein
MRTRDVKNWNAIRPLRKLNVPALVVLSAPSILTGLKEDKTKAGYNPESSEPKKIAAKSQAQNTGIFKRLNCNSFSMILVSTGRVNIAIPIARMHDIKLITIASVIN